MNKSEYMSFIAIWWPYGVIAIIFFLKIKYPKKTEYISTTARAMICSLGTKREMVVQVKYSMWIVIGWSEYS